MAIASPSGRGHAERMPLVLVLDTSASMGHPAQAPRIAELNAALRDWLRDAAADPALRERLEVAIVTFDSEVRQLPLTDLPEPRAAAWALVENVKPPELHASGLTAMLPALETAVKLATSRTADLRDAGIPYRRPLVWLVTDGAPSGPDGEPVPDGEVAAAGARLRDLAQETADGLPGCLCYAIGVGGADLATLQVLVPGRAISLNDFTYRRILGVVAESAVQQQAGSPAAEEDRTRRLLDRAQRIRALQDEYG